MVEIGRISINSEKWEWQVIAVSELPSERVHFKCFVCTSRLDRTRGLMRELDPSFPAVTNQHAMSLARYADRRETKLPDGRKVELVVVPKPARARETDNGWPPGYRPERVRIKMGDQPPRYTPVEPGFTLGTLDETDVWSFVLG